MSEWFVDRISRFSIDDEGFFDVGSGHNLLLWHVVWLERGGTEGGKRKRKFRKE